MTAFSEPQVERVSYSVPSVMTTLITWYSGWMLAFITIFLPGRGVDLSQGIAATQPIE
jgi:hypothetical protein